MESQSTEYSVQSNRAKPLSEWKVRDALPFRKWFSTITEHVTSLQRATCNLPLKRKCTLGHKVDRHGVSTSYMV